MYGTKKTDSLCLAFLCRFIPELGHKNAAHKPILILAPVRGDEKGEIILYEDQDESLWDRELISRGAYFLNRASHGDSLSRYHLEAGIAYWHTIKQDSQEKWENILQLYNQLLQVEYSPIAALNRTYALSRANGKREAIIEAEKLTLTDNRFYFTLLGELYRDIDQDKAKENFLKAMAIAATERERQMLQAKIDKLMRTA